MFWAKAIKTIILSLPHKVITNIVLFSVSCNIKLINIKNKNTFLGIFNKYNCLNLAVFVIILDIIKNH